MQHSSEGTASSVRPWISKVTTSSGKKIRSLRDDNSSLKLWTSQKLCRFQYKDLQQTSRKIREVISTANDDNDDGDDNDDDDDGGGGGCGGDLISASHFRISRCNCTNALRGTSLFIDWS